MDFWPKRWGGRNFDGDKGLGTVQTLGLPFSKQVNGDTTARKIGEFSETVIEEDGPAYFISGNLRKGGIQRYETWAAEDYKQSFSRYAGVIYAPIGKDQFVDATQAIPQPYDLSGGSDFGEYPVVNGENFTTFSRRYALTLAFFKGRAGRSTAVSGDVVVRDVQYAESALGGGDGEFDGFNVLSRYRETPSGFGPDMPPGWFLVTHAWGVSTDDWSAKISDLRVIRATREGATEFNIPRLSGTEGKPLALAALTTIGPQSYYMLASLLFSPRRYAGAAYSGGDVLFYKSADNGATWQVGTIPAIKANLPSPPTTRSPGATPEGYLYWPKDYKCDLNTALLNISVSTIITVVSPSVMVVALVQYKDVSGTMVPQGEMYRSADGGLSYSQIAFPSLLEDNPGEPVRIENMVYLGQNRLLAKTRSPGYGTDNLWNIIRSSDGGATWTCVPKAGLPTGAAPTSFFTGHFKVIAKRTSTKAGRVVLPVWGGGSYDLYESRDDGINWLRVSRLAPSEEAFRMEDDLADAVSDNNFGQLRVLGPEDSPSPLSIESPWRFDASRPYNPTED